MLSLLRLFVVFVDIRLVFATSLLAARFVSGILVLLAMLSLFAMPAGKN